MKRRFESILVPLILVLVASACGGGGSDLTYKVLGTASQANIAYTNAKGETEETTVTLPWETKFGIGGSFDFKIGVENADETGSITCEVWINERRAGGTSGVRRAECSGSFSGSKNSFSVDYRGRYDAEPEDAVQTMTQQDKMMATSLAKMEEQRATPTAPPPAPTVAPAEPTIGDIAFATDVTSDSEAIDPAISFPAGTTKVYGIFEYTDFYPGMEFAFAWYIDGQEANGDAVMWNDEPAGRTWVYFNNDDGIAPGEYELRLSVNGELAQTGSFVIEDASATSWYDQGLVHYEQGDYQAAVAAFSQAIELDPSFASTYNSRGMAYAGLDNYEQAMADFDQAIELDPSYTDAYCNRGGGFVRLGYYGAAIADFNQAIELDPSFARPYYGRGVAYKSLGDYEQAIADFDQAIELGHDPLSWPYYARGQAFRSLGNYEQAIADYSQAIELDPSYAAAYNNRGSVYNDLGYYEQAIADFDQAIELGDDPLSLPYYNRGMAYHSLGNYEQAIADYTQAAALQPNWDLTYLNRGLAYVNTGDTERAVADFRKVLEISTDPTWRQKAEEHLRELGPASSVSVSEIASLTDIYGLSDAAWSPDGAQLAVTEKGIVRIWLFTFDSAESQAHWRQVHTLVAQTEEIVESVAWSPDGAVLIGGSIDGVWVWDAKTGQVLSEPEHQYGARSFSWSPDGSTLASSSNDGKVRLWDPKSWQDPRVIVDILDTVREVAWSPNGAILASTEKEIVRLWDAVTGQELRVLEGHTDFVGHVAWSPDSTQVATTSDDQTVRIWDVATGEERHRLEHDSYASSVAWSPDGSLIASGSGAGALTVWDAANGRELLSLDGHTDSIRRLDWSPDGTMIASISLFEGVLRVWMVNVGQ